METSQISSGVSHRVRRRLAVYGGRRVDGNGLPRFGSLSFTLGSNRALDARSQIAAQNDVDAIRAWLARFVDTKATFDTYRKESERLLLWSITELRKPLSSLTHEDLLLYRRFLADPSHRSAG